MLCQAGELPRELNRLDIKNRRPLPSEAEEKVNSALGVLWPRLDALLVLDQVSEAECGVVTTGLRERLAQLGRQDPQRIILADSRERIGSFSSVWTKPNFHECSRAVGGSEEVSTAPVCVEELARRTGRPVFCTLGERGILVADPRVQPISLNLVPSFPVTGPIDIVGAGDSTSAAIACSLAAGVTPQEAAAFGNLVASITIQQIGTTGTASPEQVRRRWQEVRR
jgi:sugar/nucleoside kinase (ribokinase family)